MRKLVLREDIDFGKSLLKALLDLGKGISLVESQENVHRLVGAEVHIPDSIPVRSEQERNPKERPIAMDFTLNAGTVAIYLHLCRQGVHFNLFTVTDIIENRIRRHLIGRLRPIGNRKAPPNTRVCADEGHNLLLSDRRAVNGKRHAHPTGLQNPWHPSRHLPHTALQSRSKLKSLHSPCGNPDVSVTGIYQPGRSLQKASQETTLKDHQEYCERHTEHSHGEASAIVQDILQSEFHRVRA